MHSFLGRLDFNPICSKSCLFVRSKIYWWHVWCEFIHSFDDVSIGNRRWSVILRWIWIVGSERILNTLFYIFSVRGALLSTLTAVVSGGYLVAFLIGAFNYHAIAECSIALIALFAGLLFFLPETPVYLVKQSKIAVNPWMNCTRLRVTLLIFLVGSRAIHSILSEYSQIKRKLW